MRNHRVYFSVYDEEEGYFGDVPYDVLADTSLAARKLAWDELAKDSSSRFYSCVRQIGVTWDSSPMNMLDYFNSLAAAEKLTLNRVKYIDIPNAAIEKSESGEAKKSTAITDRAGALGSLYTINKMAHDMFRGYDISPPEFADEIECAREISYQLADSGNKDAYDKIQHIIKESFRYRTHLLRDLMNDKFLTLDYKNNMGINLVKYFTKDGIFPEIQDVNDYNQYHYVQRWNSETSISSMYSLNHYFTKNISECTINESRDFMPFDYKALILNPSLFPSNQHDFKNLLWIPTEDNDPIGLNQNSRFFVQNLITDAVEEYARKDFLGVLRPDIYALLDFDALKYNYVNNSSMTPSLSNAKTFVEPEDDWDNEL
jgi:hypothetical protein